MYCIAGAGCAWSSNSNCFSWFIKDGRI